MSIRNNNAALVILVRRTCGYKNIDRFNIVYLRVFCA